MKKTLLVGSFVFFALGVGCSSSTPATNSVAANPARMGGNETPVTAPPVAAPETNPTPGTTTPETMGDAGAASAMPIPAVVEDAGAGGDAGPATTTGATAMTRNTNTTGTTTNAAGTTTTTSGGNVAAGRTAFTRVCGRCHEDNDSEGPHPGLGWTEARMRGIVRQGNARMRAIPATRLSDGDLDNVIAYLRSTRAVR